MTVLVSLGLTIGLLLCASLLYNALEAPKMINTMSGISISGMEAPVGESVANPSYIGGTLRLIFNLLLDILPTGQSVKLAFLEMQRPVTMILSSVAVATGITVLGIVLFRKKDLKRKLQ